MTFNIAFNKCFSLPFCSGKSRSAIVNRVLAKTSLKFQLEGRLSTWASCRSAAAWPVSGLFKFSLQDINATRLAPVSMHSGVKYSTYNEVYSRSRNKLVAPNDCANYLQGPCKYKKNQPNISEPASTRHPPIGELPARDNLKGRLCRPWPKFY